jgi:type IV secretion system protein TrbF
MRHESFIERAALYPAGAEIDHPFVRARQEWDDRLGAPVQRIANLQRMVGALTLVILVLGLALAYTANNVRVLPYVVEVGQTGEVHGVGLLPQPWQGQTTAPIRYAVQEWVERLRTIGTDLVLFAEQWQKAKAFMTAKAIQVASPHMREQYEKQTKGMTVQIQLTSLLPLTPDWRAVDVEWTEKTFSQQGVLTATEDWKAIVNVGLYPPTAVTKGAELRNPLGIFVTDYHWTKKPGKDQR